MQVKVKISAKAVYGRRRVFVTVHAQQDKERRHLERYESPHRRTGRFIDDEVLANSCGVLPLDAEEHMRTGVIAWDAPLLMVHPKGTNLWKISFLLDASEAANLLLARLEAARTVEALAISLEQLQLEAEYQAIVG